MIATARMVVVLMVLTVLAAAMPPPAGAQEPEFPPPEGPPKATVDGSTVVLTWSAPSKPPPKGWSLVGYRVYRDGKHIDQVEKPAHGAKGVPAGTYLYTVTALYQLRIQQESSPIRLQVTVPPPDDDPPPDDPPPDDPPPDDPPPGGSTPPRGGSTPPGGGSTPPRGGSTPPPAGSTPPPAGSTPPPGGSTPPPEDSTPDPEPEEEADPEEVEDEPEDEVVDEVPEVLASGPIEVRPEAGPLVLDALSASPAGAVMIRGDGCLPGEAVRVTTAATSAEGVAADDGQFAIAATAPSRPGVSDVEVTCGDVIRTVPLAVVMTTSVAGSGSAMVGTVLLFFVLLGAVLWPRPGKEETAAD